MIAHRLLFIGVTTLVVAFTSSLSALEGDAEWQKVSDAVEEIKNPKTKPTSREEAITMLKSGLTSFDAAYATAVKAAPKHPTRWDAALFEVMVERAREMAGVAAPQKSTVTLDDILKAEDAKPATKSQASLMKVMMALETVEKSGSDSDAWIAQAEAHLKDFPAEPMNRMVEGKVKSMQAAAELKSKPLELKFTAVDGKAFDLDSLKGKVVLIVNVASRCGYTGQYAGLQKLYDAYKDKGLVVLGFPANEFGAQEPGSDAEIAQFCSTKYGVTFPMFSKIVVKGSGIAPLYKTLTEASNPAGDVKWNFEKFLIGRDGAIIGRYKSGVGPDDAELKGEIEAALAK